MKAETLYRSKTHVEGFPIHSKTRLYPPVNDREALQRVINCYHLLEPEKNEVAPWEKTFSFAAIPSLIGKVERKGYDLLDSLSFFSPSLDAAEGLEKADSILDETISTIKTADNRARHYETGAETDAANIVIFKTYDNPFIADEMRHDYSNLPNNTLRLLYYYGQLMKWETFVKDDNKLSEYPNIFKELVDLYLLGVNDLIITPIDENKSGLVALIKTKIDNQTIHIPWPIEYD